MRQKGKIIVIDDNKNVLTALRLLLSSYYEEVILLPSPKTLISSLQEVKPDIVLLDMNFSSGINNGNEGLYWLSEIKKLRADLPVVLFTAYADIDLAVEALKRGATDFIVKPWDNTKLLSTLQAAIQHIDKNPQKIGNAYKSEEEICIGDSSAMRSLTEKISRVAPTDANILITGENGTGKEVFARMIHSLSLRAKSPLITVDMGAITDTLFESEMFGHIKGAFTDAKNDRIGKFEVANEGTLFMDEIGNLSLTLQAKLLTALQNRKISPVGSNRIIPVNIRLICATNNDLFTSVDRGSFREDLLYRINTIHLHIPPLRDRKEDISKMALFFLKRLSIQYGKGGLSFSNEAMESLIAYRWPGNIRELQHAIEKAVILSEKSTLKAEDFYFRNNISGERFQLSHGAISIEAMEKQVIAASLERNDNNMSAVAEELGITRPTLYNKIKKYKL